MTESAVAGVPSRPRRAGGRDRRPDVVARRGHLPGLRPQLRRRQRRRHRRPRGRPLPPALPARPRGRRHLVHAVVRLAPRRRRLRRGRLPRDRPGLRHARGGRGAHRRRARPGHPDDRRHRSQSRVRPARLVPGGPRRRPGLAGARAVLVPPRARPGRRRAAHRAGRPSSRGQTWTRTTNPDGTPGRVVPAPVHARAAGPQLGPPGRPRRARGRSSRFWFDRGAAGVRIDSAALLVKDPDAARGPRRPGAGRPPEHGPRRDPRHLPGLAGGRRTAIPGTRVLVGEVWLAGRRAVRPVPPAGRAPHRLQLRLHGPAVGRGEPARLDRRRRSPRTRRSARRRPGCSRTTTSPGP